MNMIQAVPEGVIGIVGLDIVAGGLSRNAKEIRQLRDKLAVEMGIVSTAIAAIDAAGSLDVEAAWTMIQRQLVVERAVNDQIAHQLSAHNVL